jgi:hypothetical protein
MLSVAVRYEKGMSNRDVGCGPGNEGSPGIAERQSAGRLGGALAKKSRVLSIRSGLVRRGDEGREARPLLRLP